MRIKNHDLRNGVAKEIRKNLNDLLNERGLNRTLKFIYRYQLKSGFVLFNPLDKKHIEEKRFFDPGTGINFIAQWNPNREARKNQALLESRGISVSVDKKHLINKDKRGLPCGLCVENIALQKPKEILVPISLCKKRFFAGVNFASIANNHLTIIDQKHQVQEYSELVPLMMADFLNQTNNDFRIIFNGQAGASIGEHFHFQAITEKYPVEEIRIEKEDVLYNKNGVKTSTPKYFTPLWIVEGNDPIQIGKTVSDLLWQWQAINKSNTENILATKQKNVYRFFVFLRNKQKIIAPGKNGPMGTFEVSGFVVLSSSTKNSPKYANEKETYKKIDLEYIKKMIGSISPDTK